MLLEACERRLMLAARTVATHQDGFARDAGLNGTFDTLTQTGEISVRDGDVGLYEFQLPTPGSALVYSDVRFKTGVTDVATLGTIIDFYGYSSDGTLALSDATQSGTLLGTVTLTTYGASIDFPVATATFQSLAGSTGKIGVRAVTRQGFACLRSIESGGAARFTYNEVYATPQSVIIDFERVGHFGSDGTISAISTSYNEDGYRLSGPITIQGAASGDSYLGSSTATFDYHRNSTSQSLVRLDGGLFTLRSLDLSKFSPTSSEAYVLFTGTKADGTTVQQGGWASHFGSRTLQFAGFDGLRSVSWTVPRRLSTTDAVERYQIDNIVVASVEVNVPGNQPPSISDQSFSVSEMAPSGAIVGQLTATDADSSSLSYRLLSSTVSGAFDVTANGEIRVLWNHLLDTTRNPFIDLVVGVTDGATGSFDIARARVTIQDVGDDQLVRIAPAVDGTITGTVVNSTDTLLPVNTTGVPFSFVEFSRSAIPVSEIQGAVLEFDVEGDARFGESYSLRIDGYVASGSPSAVPASTRTLWSGVVRPGRNVVNLSATELRTLASGTHWGIRFANPSYTYSGETPHNFRIRSTEHSSGGPQLRVLRYANQAPVLNNVTWDLPENSSYWTLVGQLTSTDPNGLDSATYSLVSSSVDGAFSVTSSGQVRVFNTTLLNRETTPEITLTVRATDTFSFSALSTTATVTIRLTDVNEAGAFDSATFTIPENSPAGTVVGTVPFSADPEGDAVTFSISGGAEDAFEIDAAGVVRVKAGANPNWLNYEWYRSPTITVTALDARGLARTGYFTVNLSNLNEGPVFHTSPSAVTTPEFPATGTLLNQFYAFDPEGQTQTFSIESISAAPGDAVAFAPATGRLTVQNSAAFDYALRSQFTVTVKVTDNDAVPLSSTVTLTIHISPAQAISVREGDVLIGTVRSPSTFGPGRTFSIVSGDPQNLLSINSVTGAITTRDPLGLSYPNSPKLDLVVRVTDGASTFDRPVPITVTTTRFYSHAVRATEFTSVPDATGVRTWQAVAPAATQRIQGGPGTQSRVGLYSNAPFTASKYYLRVTIVGTEKLAAEASTPLEIFATRSYSASSSSYNEPWAAGQGIRVGQIIVQAGDVASQKTYLIEIDQPEGGIPGYGGQLSFFLRNTTNSNVVTIDASVSATAPWIATPIQRPARDGYYLPMYTSPAPVGGGRIYVASPYYDDPTSSRSGLGEAALRPGIWWRLDNDDSSESHYSGGSYPITYQLIGQATDGKWCAGHNASSLLLWQIEGSLPNDIDPQAMTVGRFLSPYVPSGFSSSLRSLVGRDGSGQWWRIEYNYGSSGYHRAVNAGGSWSTSVNWVDVKTGDLDGDGIDEIMGRNAVTGEWTVSRFTATGMTHETWGSWSTSQTWRDVHVEDFTGDGRADLLARDNSGQLWISRSTGTSFVMSAYGSVSTHSPWAESFVGDFDNNQIMDLLVRNAAGEWWLARSNRTGFDIEQVGQWSASGSWSSGTVIQSDLYWNPTDQSVLTIEASTNFAWIFTPSIGQTQRVDLGAGGEASLRLLNGRVPVVVPSSSSPAAPVSGTPAPLPARFVRTSAWQQPFQALTTTFTNPATETVPAVPLVLPASVGLPLVGGMATAIDTGSNGTVDSISTYRTGYGVSGADRWWTIMEFSRNRLPAGALRSASLTLNVGLTGASTQFRVFGYSGNGQFEIADGTASNTEVGTATVNATGTVTVTLDSTWVQSLTGNFIGLIIQPVDPAAASVSFSSPQLNVAVDSPWGAGYRELPGTTSALDGNTLAILRGALIDIYTRTGATWTQQATLRLPNSSNDVRLSLRGNRLVAADFQNESLEVFERSGTTWTRTARIVPNSSSFDAWFNGYEARVIQPTDRSINWGREVYTLQGGTWQAEMLSVIPSASTGNRFVLADYEGVKIYDRVDGAWLKTTLALDAEFANFAPTSVILDGDRLFAAYPEWSRYDSATRLYTSGVVLVWERVGGVWQETARLYSDSISSNNYREFGQAMALSGNLLTVSSRRDGGRLELFEKVGATWTRMATVPTKYGSSIQRLTMSGRTVLVEDGYPAGLYEFPVSIPAYPARTLTVKEQATFGTVVGSAGLTPLAGQSYRYEITSGNTGDVFRIDPGTGEITVKRGSSLDFETTPAYTLTVAATEASGLTVSTTVTVQLVNLAEPQSQIIDNGGIGFATTGTWTNENSGRGRSVLRTPAGDGTAQATWTFNGLTPGVYRIAATWSANSNRTTTAPYRVLVNGNQAATKTFNQRNTPTEFVQDGSGWRVIGTITVTGNDSTLVTELVNTTTTGFTIADAVRLDRQGAITQSPDIELSSGGNVLSDGAGVIDFGSGPIGTTTFRDLRVTNRGPADLTISSITLPAGYQWTVPWTANLTLGPGDWQDLTIASTPSAAGTSTGTLQLISDDGDESPYEITLTSTRTALEQPLARITVNGVEVPAYSGTIDFGSTVSGIAVARTVQIQNVGTGILRFPASWLTEIWNENFQIDSTGTDVELAPGESTTFVIRFLARKLGTSRDRLKTGAYWGWMDQPQASAYFNLIGYVQAGRLALESSGPLDALPNQVVTATYTYRNTGDLTTILQPATLSGSSRFTILSNFTANQAVAPGATASITVQYAAGAEGMIESAYFQFTATGHVTSVSQSLVGRTLAPEIRVNLVNYSSSDIVDGASNFLLWNVPVNSVTGRQEFRVTNNGATNLVLQPVTAPAGFRIVQNFTVDQVLATYGSAILAIEPDTTVAGIFTGEIIIPNNDPNESPFNFTVRSTVFAPPEIDVSVDGQPLADGATLDFGTSAGTTIRKTIRITNSGTGVLTLNPQPISAANGFRVLTPFATGTQLPAGGFLDVVVELVPGGSGLRSWTWQISNNDSNENPYDITLRGTVSTSGTFSLWEGATAIPTDSYLWWYSQSFGTTTRGTAVTKTWTIRNTGTAPLALGTPVQSGSQFTILDPLPDTLAAGAAVNFRIRLNATAIGSVSETLMFPNSDSLRPANGLNLTGTVQGLQEATVLVDGNNVTSGATLAYGTTTPDQPISKIFTIRNDGQDLLTLSSLIVNGQDWELIGSLPSSLAPGASTTITIRRIGIVAGSNPGELRFLTNDSNETNYLINLSGTVTGSGEISLTSDGTNFITGSTVEFGVTRIGSPVTKSFVLKNLGTSTLYLGTPIVPAGYTLLDVLPATLAAGAEFTFRVRQNAATIVASPQTDFLTIPSSDGDEGRFLIVLRQAIHAPQEIEVSVDGVNIPDLGTLDFGTTLFGVPVTKTLVVRNTGTAPLSIGQARWIVNYSPFRIVSQSFTGSLAPGATASIVVQLTAESLGTYSGYGIEFTTDDTDEGPSFVFVPRGQVTSSGEISITEGGVNILRWGSATPMTTVMGTPITKTLTITNEGSTNLYLLPATVSGDYSLVSNFTAGQVVAPGTSVDLQVRATAVSAGTRTGSVTIRNSDGDESSYVVNLSTLVRPLASEVKATVNSTTTLDNTGTIDFGEVVVGRSAQQTITIENTGTVPLVLQPVLAPVGFEIVQNFTTDQTVAVGGTATLVVRMVTTSAGLQSGQIAFVTNDPQQRTFDFRVKGQVVLTNVPEAPIISGPTVFSFEEFSPRWTVIGNLGAIDANGDSITYSIVSGNPDDTLFLTSSGPDAGRLWVNKQDLTGLRHRGMFNLRIRATDNSSQALSTEFDVRVFITPAGISTSIRPAVDGAVLDADGNGFDAGDTTDATGPGMLIQGGTNPSRGVLEFDLSAIPANRPLKSAWFFFHTSSLVGGTTVSVPIDIFGYTGNGTLEASDAGLGTKIGSRPISNAGGSNQLKVHSAPLDVAYVRTLIGTGQLGLVLRNDGSADGVVIDTSDSAAHAGQKPYLLLQFSDLKPDLVVRDISGTGNELLTLTSNGTSFTASAANVFGVGPWEQFLAGDFNGDGRSDIAARKTSDGTWWISLMGTTGVPEAAVSWVTTSTSTVWSSHLVSDFDGDGRSDIAARNAAGEWWVWQSTGTSLAGRNWGSWETGTTWQNLLVADFNRDGRADIAGRNSTGQWFVSLASGATSANVVFSTSQWGQWSTATTWSDVQVGDFNGDGRADIAGRSAIGQWWVNRSTGTSFSAALYYGNWSTGTTWSDVRVADFNGDGRDDIIGRTSIGQWWVAEVATSGFAMKHLGNWSAPQSKWTDVRVGDFNRDGRADLVARNSLTHELWTSLWSPTGFITSAWVTLPDGTSRSWQLLASL